MNKKLTAYCGNLIRSFIMYSFHSVGIPKIVRQGADILCYNFRFFVRVLNKSKQCRLFLAESPGLKLNKSGHFGMNGIEVLYK